jgi:predicted AlkP superfamily phosphohydrolase/phosphomutase
MFNCVFGVECDNSLSDPDIGRPTAVRDEAVLQPGTRRIIVVAVLASAWIVYGCGGASDEATDLATVVASIPRPAPKIVLIGLDGADWNVARPLMEDGRLPVLSSLVANGASGDLRSLEPMLSPALWTTVVTGVGPERHGIRDFVFKQPGTYAQPIVNASLRERLALWNIFSGLDMTVGVVDWYATWPAEPVNGFIVSDRIKTLGAEGEGVTYPGFAELGDALADPPPLGELPALERLKRRGDPLPAGLDKALREDLYRYRLAKGLYRDHRPDFFAFYLKGLDAVGHFYWKYFDPDEETFGEVDERDVARLGSIIPEYYELCDQLLGEFLEILDDGATVLIVSDHGFRSFGRPDSLIFDLDRLFALMGLLEFEDPATAADRSHREIRMAGTRAYTHEGTKIVSAFGRRDRPVYLNVAGRDPDGVIDADGWREARANIVTRLESLRTDLDTRVFSHIRVNDGAADGTAQQEPDLYLRVNPEIAFDYDVMIDGQPHSLADVFFWEYGNISGTHRQDGILVARGPSIRPGVKVDGASLLDIAPTILHLAGAPVPGDLDGKVLRSMLVEHGGDGRVRVASYEGMIGREYSPVDTSPIDEEYRNRLRALGYVQ